MLAVVKHGLRILPYLYVFIASLYLPTDPDLGWHLKYGEYFFQHHQILRDNIFSTMMPNYQWANGSWGTDILTYIVFTYGGFFGLTLVSAAVVTVTFFFFARAAKLTFIEEALFFPLLVYLELPVNDISFRGQQLSLLFLGILFFILSTYKNSSKVLFSVPLLFLLWCNLQEESFLGLVLFGLWIVLILTIDFFITFREKHKNFFKKELIFLGSIFVVTFLITFLNPFGWGIHVVALSHFYNPLLKTISEYVPFTLFSNEWWNQVIITMLLIIGILTLFLRKKLLPNLILFAIPLILLLISLDVRRYAWPSYYLTIPFFHLFGNTLASYLKRYALLIACILSILSICYTITIKMPFTQFITMSWDTYCQAQTVPCSPTSAHFLQTHKLAGKVFSYYDWGGWLIWNYTDIKPSIDGRMHVWRDTYGYSATAEYAIYETAQKSIDNSPYDIVYLPNENSPLVAELSTLIQQKKWKVVYEDELAGIVERIKK